MKANFIFYLVFIISVALFAQPNIAPESVGISAQRLKRLNKMMENYIQTQKVAGITTMIARRGQIVHSQYHGNTKLKDGSPIQKDTIFRIYSMSKPITSVAIMILYEEGHFKLYDPVSKFIPEFKNLKVFVAKTEQGAQLEPMKRQPTIRDLITHTSGLTYGFFGKSAVDKMYLEHKVMDFDKDLETMVQKLTKLPLKHQPGAKWEYSLSIDVLGYLVEIMSGQTLDKFFQERIFNPLEMEDTGFYVPAGKLHRFTALYESNPKGGIRIRDQKGYFTTLPKFLSGGGGLVSTAPDYMRFCTMLLNKGKYKNRQILGRKTVEFMMSNHLLPNQLPFAVSHPYWGYGFGLGGAVVIDPAQTYTLGTRGSFTWSGAASTFFIIDPGEELIGLFFTQFWPYGYYDLGAKFRTLMYQAIVD